MTWMRTGYRSMTSAMLCCRLRSSARCPEMPLTADDYAKNNLPDVLARWKRRDKEERERPRTAQSFCVPKADIAAQGYDLSLNRYKEVVHREVPHDPPKEILKRLRDIEEDIQQRMKEFEEMLR